MRKGVFITGTGTDVGKTIVTSALARGLRARGVNAATMKPLQTGGTPDGHGRLLAPDLEFVLQTIGIAPDEKEKRRMAPWVCEPACSPHLAGKMRGEYPAIPDLIRAADSLLEKYETLLVEGAGGVLVPLDETHTTLDLMQTLSMPVLLVASPGLGTINHTLLSIEAIRRANLVLLGVIFCETEPTEETFITQDNPRAIARHGETEILGTVRYHPALTPENKEAWDQIVSELPAIDRLEKLSRDAE